MPHTKTFASLALALALAAAPAVAADPQPDQHHPAPAAAAPAPGMGMGTPNGAGAGNMPMAGMMQTMMGGGMAMMAEHVEGRIAFLKAELKITDAQLPQWNAFAEALRDNAATMQSMMGSMMGQAAALPDKLSVSEKQLAARLEMIRKLRVAAGPLYAVLSADQKKSADDIIVSPMGMMM